MLVALFQLPGIDLPESVAVALGACMSLMLGFRLQVSYERWWEGRLLWGRLIISMRAVAVSSVGNLSAAAADATASDAAATAMGSPWPPALFLSSLLPASVAGVVAGAAAGRGVEQSRPQAPSAVPNDVSGAMSRRLEVAGWCVAVAIALKQHLRGEDLVLARAAGVPARAGDSHGATDADMLADLLPPSQLRRLTASNHRPLFAVAQLRRALGLSKLRAQAGGGAGGGGGANRTLAVQLSLFKQVQSLVETITGCERILRTPCPPSYVTTLRYVMVIWLLMLPSRLVETLGVFVFPMVGTVAFCLFAVEGIAVEIENPFGSDVSDLPLETFCRTIRSDAVRLLVSEANGDGGGDEDEDEDDGAGNDAGR